MIQAAAASAADQNLDRLRSVFLIGSCSDEVPDEWYQDFDVHFLFDGLALRPETLAWFRDVLQRCRDLGDEVCRVEAFAKDRHWKMVPDRSYPLNIGAHATLLNSADHYRRVHLHPVLASNMYVRCGVVFGEHPARIRGWRPTGAAMHVHSVGGLGWLAENLARAVSLFVLTPGDHTFYPFIGGYTWNVASSALFHLYTFDAGGITSRKAALDHFLSHSEVARPLKDAASLLYEHREDPSGDPDFGRRQANAAAAVLRHVRSRLAMTAPAYDAAGPSEQVGPQVIHHGPLYQDSLAGVGGDPAEVVDVVRAEADDDYFASIVTALGAAREPAGSELSSKENFEFLRDLTEGGDRHTKVRIWDRTSLPRRLFSDDFASARGAPTEVEVMFGWEDGVQALLQRLHELHVELGADSNVVSVLARVAAAVAQTRLSSFGLAADLHSGDGEVFSVTAGLERLLRPHVPPLPST
jgi:hypothetical protein